MLTLAPPVAPYVPVRDTALHRNMVSSISQVISERIDQSWSVLFLVRHSKDFRGYQKVHDRQFRSPVPSLSGIGNSLYAFRGNMALQIAMKLHQFLVDASDLPEGAQARTVQPDDLVRQTEQLSG